MCKVLGSIHTILDGVSSVAMVTQSSNMVRVTLDLVRKRSEHNDGVLHTLEEIALHQLDIEAIDNIQRWCPMLKILLLQGNLISKIENLGRLRSLEYINLALNNIECITGLENCEALTKIDFTGNFIIDLLSVKSLENLANLRELFLVGNPCTSYRGYRPYVIVHLPQLAELDGSEIGRAETIRSLQSIQTSIKSVQEDQAAAFQKRLAQKKAYAEREPVQPVDDSEEELRRWNEEVTENCPETRWQYHQEMARRRERSEKANQSPTPVLRRPIKFFTEDDRPLNVNKANVDFEFNEEEDCFTIELFTYKYLDTSMIDCDVQPKYIRINVRGKPLQLVWLSEVKCDETTVLRSDVTGHLFIRAPKVHEGNVLKTVPKKPVKTELATIQPKETKANFLEIEPSLEQKLTISPETNANVYTRFPPERPNSSDFKDTDEVPPLE